MNKMAVFALLLLTVSCGEYFSLMNATDPVLREQILWLLSGGKVSSDTANDITPFVYTYNITGKKYLFFASDRGGNYDIYYAEMGVDGMLEKPVALSSIINSASNEISPALCDANGTNNISFLRISGSTTNLMTYTINAGFSGFNWDQTTPVDFKQISIILVSGNPNFIGVNGTTGIYTSSPGTSTPLWSPGVSFSIASNAYGIFGLESAATSNNYIFQTIGEQFSGFCRYGIIGSSYSYYPLSVYSSPYRDTTPFIDPDNGALYFASDRYGMGKFDLYRYNKNPFTEQIPH